MKIYFAGSIRGGRRDKDLYLEIVKKLAAFGTVFTEHVADPKLTSYGDTGLSDTEIYERDVRWLAESDVVIAEVTTTSLGVGYELGLAESLHKKILCLYNEQRAQLRMPEKSAEEVRRFSPMITGNRNMAVKFYKELGELDGIFAEFLT